MSAAIAEPPAKPATEIAPATKPPGEEAASFLESLHGEKPKPKAADKSTDEVKTKADKDAADKTAAKAKPAAEKKAATPKPSPPAEPDYEKIAEAAGRGVAAAIRKSEPEYKADADPLTDLDDDDRERHAAYVQMEKDYPSRYNGLGKKFLDSIKKADAWEEQWLNDHPGEEVDENSTEYKEQEEKIAIQYNDLHFQKAVAALEIEKREAKSRATGNVEIEALKLKEREREAMPRIMATRVAAARNYFDALGDEFKDVLDANGNINHEAITKLVDADPLKQIALMAAEGVEKLAHDLQIKSETFAHEIRELASNPNSFNPKNEDHSEIDNFVTLNENHLASLSLDEQQSFLDGLPDRLRAVKTGKRFATAAQYAAIPDSKRSQYYRLNADDMAYLYSVEQSETAKAYAIYESKKAKEMIAAEEKRVEELAAKRGWKKVDAAATVANATAESAPKSPVTAPLTPSPSGTIEPRQALPAGAKNGADKNPADSFTRQWLG